MTSWQIMAAVGTAGIHQEQGIRRPRRSDDRPILGPHCFGDADTLLIHLQKVHWRKQGSGLILQRHASSLSIRWLMAGTLAVPQLSWKELLKTVWETL